MIDVQGYIYRLGFLKTQLHIWIDNYPNHVLLNHITPQSVPRGYVGCQHGEHKCDRMGVCLSLGGCMFEHEIIKSLPLFMKSQIKKATSPQKALQLLHSKRYLKNEKVKKDSGQRV